MILLDTDHLCLLSKTGPTEAGQDRPRPARSPVEEAGQDLLTLGRDAWQSGPCHILSGECRMAPMHSNAL
jgi:hypothetical protein